MMRRVMGMLFLLASAPYAVSAQLAIDKVYNDVGIDQMLGSQVPPDLVFRDETGKDVTLGGYFGDKPVILSLVYYQCPMLCTEVLNGMVSSFKGLNLTAGEDFTVLSVSINPRETPELAAQKKEIYLASYGRESAYNGWHFLTGDEASIERLAQAVGFHYLYDKQSDQYAHATGIMVLTPGGRLSHYFYGVEYSSRDVKFAMMDASDNKVGSVVDKLLLLCYHYDPGTGKYGVVIANIFRAAGAATILVVGGFIFLMVRRERRQKMITQAEL